MDKELFFFFKNAYTDGLCDEYKTEIRKCHENKLMLIKLAMRQQSIPWVATKILDGKISTRYLKENFSEYLNGKLLENCDNVYGYAYKWFVEYDKDVICDVDVMHISLTKNIDVIIPECKCPTIYVSNMSSVNIICEGYNSVRVYLMDSSTVTLKDVDEESSIIIYRYSDMAKVEVGKYCMSDNVRIFNKELRL